MSNCFVTDYMDCSLSSSSVRGISQATMLESSAGNLPNLEIKPESPALAGWTTREANKLRFSSKTKFQQQEKC